MTVNGSKPDSATNPATDPATNPAATTPAATTPAASTPAASVQARVHVRRAIPGDEQEILRLRHQMARDVFGATPPPPDEPNHVAALKKLRAWLECRDDAQTSTVSFVIDAPDGNGLASTAIGAVDERLPSARNPAGRTGYIYGVCTDGRFRRRGYSRMAMTALIDWYTAQGITRIELHASEYGEPLYRELGFAESRGLALTRWVGQQ